MRKLLSLAAFVMACVGIVQGQQTAAAPQTARQALIEMFFSKTPGTFAKHLPAATVAALEKTGALANLQQYSAFMTQLQTQGHTIQTFETGSVLLITDDAKTGQKAEITVENDTLHGDQDDLELTFHATKDGQEQMSPFMPQMVFSMKQESQIWKLNEISFTIHVPLADPKFLAAMTQKMTPQAGNVALTQHGEVSAVPAGSDATVLAAMRTILTAEVTYAATYPTVGFTCSLSDLDGFGGGQPNEHQAMLINSGLASGKRFGFVFTLSGCSGAPASAFHLTAAPNANTFGRKAFCADQSALIRSSADGNAAACLANGAPIQ
ncbi:MAG: hypothetical protein ABSG34_00065 [Candidatus Sulfotelmatobacter sp.]|jgi:hypothetical protein